MKSIAELEIPNIDTTSFPKSPIGTKEEIAKRLPTYLKEVAKHINHLTEEATLAETLAFGVNKYAINCALLVGGFLTEVRRYLPKGFDAWVKANLKVTRMTAYNYRRLYEWSSSHINGANSLRATGSLRQAYLLAEVLKEKKKAPKSIASEESEHSSEGQKAFEKFFVHKTNDTPTLSKTTTSNGAGQTTVYDKVNHQVMDDDESSDSKPSKKSDDEQAQELATTNDPLVIVKATLYLLQHTREDKVNDALNAIRPIVDWYSKHYEHPQPQKNADRLKELKKSKVSIDIGTGKTKTKKVHAK